MNRRSLAGVLTVDGDGHGAVATIAGSIPVEDPRLLDALLAVVPVRVGGLFLYSDPAELDAEVSVDGLVITKVHRMRIVSDGEVFDIVL